MTLTRDFRLSHLLLICLTLLPLAAGCASHPQQAKSEDVVLLVPGAGGDGPWHNGVIKGLVAGGYRGNVEIVHWGAPGALFMLNMQNTAVHERAQEKLAATVIEWRLRHPAGRIDLVAHSAGCGVALGALKWIGQERHVNNVVLLRPSVSPQYELTDPLKHITGKLYVFYSDQDNVFLKWRTGTFGTYDNVRTEAAGRVGFTGTDKLPADLRSHCVQYAYNPAWKSLHEDGGHFGPLAEPFAQTVISPLLSR